MSLRNAEFLRGSQVERRERLGEKVTSLPPFLSYIEAAIWKAQNETEVRHVVEQSHKIDQSFLGWEVNRKGNTPVGFHGTGYEGFFVGRDVSQDEVHAQLLEMGIDIWRGIRLQHRHSYGRRLELEKVIRGESHASSAVEEWMAIFGASLARQRAQILTNKAAQEYRSQTKSRVSTLPKITYVLDPQGQVQQEYYVPAQPVSDVGGLFQGLRDEEELALTTMQNIGKFGHPLVRSAAEFSRR